MKSLANAETWSVIISLKSSVPNLSFSPSISLILLIVPAARRAHDVLAVACVCVFIATWIDKGVGLVIGGFIPNPLEHVTEYVATVPEILITLGVWATGFFILSALYKVAVTVKEEQEQKSA